jgi:hypothetical protein
MLISLSLPETSRDSGNSTNSHITSLPDGESLALSPNTGGTRTSYLRNHAITRNTEYDFAILGPSSPIISFFFSLKGLFLSGSNIVLSVSSSLFNTDFVSLALTGQFLDTLFQRSLRAAGVAKVAWLTTFVLCWRTGLGVFEKSSMSHIDYADITTPLVLALFLFLRSI